ncbi:hypothetical protein ACLOJK_035086, partial [Asimina triloba]
SGVRIDEGPVDLDSSSSTSSSGASSYPSPPHQSSPQKIIEPVHMLARRVKKVVSRPSKTREKQTPTSKSNTETPLRFLSPEEETDFLVHFTHKHFPQGKLVEICFTKEEFDQIMMLPEDKNEDHSCILEDVILMFTSNGDAIQGTPSQTSQDLPHHSSKPIDVNVKDFLVDPKATVVGIGPCSRQTSGHDDVETMVPNASTRPMSPSGDQFAEVLKRIVVDHDSVNYGYVYDVFSAPSEHRIQCFIVLVKGDEPSDGRANKQSDPGRGTMTTRLTRSLHHLHHPRSPSMAGEPISISSDNGSSIRLPLPDPATLRQQRPPPPLDLTISVDDIISFDVDGSTIYNRRQTEPINDSH